MNNFLEESPTIKKEENINPFLKEKSGIIIAADVERLDQLGDLVELSRVKEVVAIKIGFSLVLKYGLFEIVDFIKESDRIPVIYDHQKAGTDIPQMGKPFAEICKDGGADAVIIFPQSGPSTLEVFVKSLQKKGITPIVGALMTHPHYLVLEGGYIDDQMPMKVIKQALDLGVKDFILPSTKLESVSVLMPLFKGIEGINFLMPGIGSQGGTIKESFNSVKGHNFYPIIGSAIYKAMDPALEIKKFGKEIEK